SLGLAVNQYLAVFRNVSSWCQILNACLGNYKVLSYFSPNAKPRDVGNRSSEYLPSGEMTRSSTQGYTFYIHQEPSGFRSFFTLYHNLRNSLFLSSPL
ncbi:hypothetical protein C0J52_28130, partial [Blattella germanica]